MAKLMSAEKLSEDAGLTTEKGSSGEPQRASAPV